MAVPKKTCACGRLATMRVSLLGESDFYTCSHCARLASQIDSHSTVELAPPDYPRLSLVKADGRAYHAAYPDGALVCGVPMRNAHPAEPSKKITCGKCRRVIRRMGIIAP